MSGIAGAVRRDGPPLTAECLVPLLPGIAHRGADRRGSWASADAALTATANWTVPQDVGSEPVAENPAAGIHAVLDGRIDNRSELVAQLQLSPRAAEADVLLAAYTRWGADTANQLRGDFAFAIWDAPAQRLYCARDPFGIRPLYYAATDSALVFASEIAAVLAYPAVSGRFNEGAVAETAANRIRTPGETRHAAVSVLPSGHELIAAGGQLRVRRYWNPSYTERSFASDSDCAEEFLALLRQAVSRMLRRTGRGAAYLSGGLDSSSVLAVACQLLPADSFVAVTQVFPGDRADESNYVDQFLARYPVRPVRVPFAEPDPNLYAARAAQYRDFPGYPNGSGMHESLVPALRANHVKVILGGQGGNHLLDGYSSVLPDLLRAGQWREFRLAAAGYTRAGDSLPGTMLRLGLRPLLPIPARIRRARKSPADFWPLDPGFIRRTNLLDRAYPALPHWREFGSLARRDVALGMQSALSDHDLRMMERDTAHHGHEERSPFFDRDLAEFALSLPEQMRQRGGVWKQVLRQAAAPLLPEAYIRRQVQAEFSGPFRKVVEAAIPPPLDVLEGILAPDVLKSAEGAGGLWNLLEARGVGLLRRWAILGVAYFLDAERRR